MNNLKVIIFMLVVFATPSFAQRTYLKEYCRYIDGFWGEWHQRSVSGYTDLIAPRVQGSYDNFVIYSAACHPSEYSVKIQVDNFRDKIDKKEKKQRIKEKQYYKYSGTIEFYLRDKDTPTTIKQWVEQWDGGFPAKYSKDKFTGNEVRKIVYPAKILIMPYKDTPECYNVFFGSYGIAFTLY